ncbi:MAG: adenosylhomocysteinase [Acidimicrobiales bacterium]|jgi:adenosylhomocysteinase
MIGGRSSGDIADLSLASRGRQRIAWAGNDMPVLASIRERFERERPLDGLVIGACLHVTTETANLLKTLKAGGATVLLCASNPLSIQDDVAACLVADEAIATFAVKGENHERYYAHIDAVLDGRPELTMDDGCDLVSRLHQLRGDQLGEVVGGTEDTTTGVIRLRAMEAAGVLAYPIVAVNDARTKRLFDNRYGTGQSTLDGIIRATNILVAGKRFVIAGYGSCGKGVAARARGMGALVTVTEIDPLRALEAVMDGFAVEPMEVAAREGEVFVTVTGNTQVLRAEHFAQMRDGAILANAGHFDVEIDLAQLEAMADDRRHTVRPMVEEFTVRSPEGVLKRILLLAEGRLVNLSAAEGHPSAVMDISFANHALAAEWLARDRDKLSNRVHAVPGAIDAEIARLKLATMGTVMDGPTESQRAYLASWTAGP